MPKWYGLQGLIIIIIMMIMIIKGTTLSTHMEWNHVVNRSLQITAARAAMHATCCLILQSLLVHPALQSLPVHMHTTRLQPILNFKKLSNFQ
jgi:hypothetical protein